MQIVTGRGNNRKELGTIPTGYRMRQLRKNDAVEYGKIKTGILALVRNQ